MANAVLENAPNMPNVDEIEAQLRSILTDKIPDGRNVLKNNFSGDHHNFARLATYCQDNFTQAPDKTKALSLTRNYCNQSLSFVAYQICALATDFTEALKLQEIQLQRMQTTVNEIAEGVNIHREKVARREIGNITANKNPPFNPQRIIPPTEAEKQQKYVRRPIDFSGLDDIGHGVRIKEPDMRGGGGFMGTGRRNSAGDMQQQPRGYPRKKHSLPFPPNFQNVMNGVGGTMRRPKDLAPEAPHAPSDYQPGSVAFGSLASGQTASASNTLSRARGLDASSAVLGLPVQEAAIHLEKVAYRNPKEVIPSGGGGTAFDQRSDSGSTNSGSNDYRQPNAALFWPQSLTSSVQQPQEHSGSGLVPGGQAMLNPASTLNRNTKVAQGMEYVGGEYRPQINFEPRPEQYLPHATSPNPNNPPPISLVRPSGGYMQQQQQQQYNPGSQVPGGMGRGNPPPPQQVAVPAISPVSMLPVKERVRAMYDYTADQEDELTFAEGEIIYVIKMNEDGWYEGYMDNNQHGLFPGNYVESID